MWQQMTVTHLSHCYAHDLPSRVFVQLIEDGLLTELKHQVEPSFPPEDLEQVDQIHMFQLLQGQWRTGTMCQHSTAQMLDTMLN